MNAYQIPQNSDVTTRHRKINTGDLPHIRSDYGNGTDDGFKAGTNALVVFNPAAGGGRAIKRWEVQKPYLIRNYTPHIVETDHSGTWKHVVEKSIKQGIRVFIAAGGDGTIHALVDALVRLSPENRLEEFTLGAIGLGSSNDFHKPVARRINGIPARIGRETTSRDICRIRFSSPDAPTQTQTRYFLVSASIGMAAEANGFFMYGNPLMRWLKSRWTAGAIYYATLHTLVNYRNLPAELKLTDSRINDCKITNLSIGKTPWVSGNFRYDTPVCDHDGKLTINLSENLSRAGIMKLLWDLSQGKFLNGPHRHYWKKSQLTIETRHPVHLELDGEIYRTSYATFDVLDQKINICT